uniref:(northern house mosquito) hypothetical protein n=1 Tax=Culex pipiens TaxID=7175 RepID=A0A8D8C008_CULPI
MAVPVQLHRTDNLNLFSLFLRRLPELKVTFLLHSTHLSYYTVALKIVQPFRCFLFTRFLSLPFCVPTFCLFVPEKNHFPFPLYRTLTPFYIISLLFVYRLKCFV